MGVRDQDLATTTSPEADKFDEYARSNSRETWHHCYLRLKDMNTRGCELKSLSR